MSIEKPENSHLKIVHIKGSQDSNPKEVKNDLNPDDIDFSTPQEITLEFLSKVTLADPHRENEKRKLLNIILKETDPKIKQSLWETLLRYIQESDEAEE